MHVSFTLRNNLLISIREDDIGLVRLLRHYMRQDRLEVEDALDILLEVQNLKVEYLSDLIEDGYKTLENTADQIFEPDQINPMLKELMAQEEANGQIRLSLHDTRRALRFLKRSLRQRMTGSRTSGSTRCCTTWNPCCPIPSSCSTRSTSSWRPPWGDQSGAEQGDQDLLGSRGDLPAADPYRQHLRHELWPHAGARLGIRLPLSLVLMVMSSLGTGLFFKRKGWL